MYDAILPQIVPCSNNAAYIRNNALALYLDMRLTKRKYQLLRIFNKKNNVSNEKFPEYGQIQRAKIDCYPSNIVVTDVSASVDMQDLVSHTVFRLIHCLKSEDITKLNNRELLLKCKWGMDGSSSQQRFKQGFMDCASNDASVFSVMFVPLDLNSPDESIWSNERPTSTRLCRPISFQFVKETADQTLKTFNEIQGK